jgi:hypothetical protein
MRTFLGAVLGAILVLLSGCGPSVPDEELGTIVYEVPKIEAEEPYQLPDIPAPAGIEKKASKESHEH